jgi:cytochrome c nitrite reductase small subunit
MSLKRRALELLSAILPPPEWRIPVLVAFGITAGLGLHILHVSKAFSYLSDKSEVCMNCHVMTTQFATWERGNHGHVTNCNDCHVPHDNVVKKYGFKAIDGLRHSTMFTLRLEPQVIRIKEMGIGAVQSNCLRCHERTVMNIKVEKEENCWRCHRETPHGRVNSLAATPFARVPRLENPVPAWLDKLIATEKKARETSY